MDIPARFALIDDNRKIYRGGQPNETHIKMLTEKGIKTIINLRKEDLMQRKEERKLCEKYNIEYIEFPFYGIFGFNPDFVHEVIDNIHKMSEKGPIYIHCLNGRDRTSVMVASYFVKYENKNSTLAWMEDVIKYDHDENDKYYSKFKTSFQEFCDKL